MNAVWTLWTAAVAVAFLLPTEKFLLFDGLPLNPGIVLPVLVLMAGVFFVLPINAEKLKKRNPQFLWILAALAFLKVFGGWLAPDRGLKVRVFSNRSLHQPYEKSSLSPNLDATEIAKRVNYPGVSYSNWRQYLNMTFLNDHRRFGPWDNDDNVVREKFAFSATWTTHLFVPSSGETRFFLNSEFPATLLIDGKRVQNGVPIAIEKGAHPLEVQYFRDHADRTVLSLEWERDGKRGIIPGRNFYLANIDAAQYYVGIALTFFNLLIVGLCLIGPCFMILSCVDRRQIGFATFRKAFLWCIPFFCLLQSIQHAEVKAAHDPTAPIMSRGNDWLTYETLARSMLMGGLHTHPMDEEKGTFYLVPLYRYALTSMHFLVGENPMDVLILHSLMRGIVILLTVLMVGLVTANLWLAIATGLLFCWTGLLIEDQRVILPTMPAVLFASASYYFVVCAGHGWRHAWWLAGGFFAIASGIRPELLGWLPPSLALWAWIGRKDWRSTFRQILQFTLPVLVVPFLVGVRSYMVAGKFAATSSNFNQNFNHIDIPPQIDVEHGIATRSVYRFFPVLTGYAKHVEFLSIYPGKYFRELHLKRFLWSLGARLDDAGNVLVDNLALYRMGILGLLACLYFLCLSVSSSKTGPLFPLTAFYVTHLAMMCVIGGITYGYRHFAPLFPLMFLFTAVALEKVAHLVGAQLRTRIVSAPA